TKHQKHSDVHAVHIAQAGGFGTRIRRRELFGGASRRHRQTRGRPRLAAERDLQVASACAALNGRSNRKPLAVLPSSGVNAARRAAGSFEVGSRIRLEEIWLRRYLPGCTKRRTKEPKWPT